MRTVGSQKPVSPRRPDGVPETGRAATPATRRAHRAAFVTGAAAFSLAVLVGASHSLRSEHRLPAPDLLVDGPARHVERLLERGNHDGAVRQLIAYQRLSNDRLPHERLTPVLARLGPDARAAFAAALRATPGYAAGHRQLGLAFSSAREYESAATQLQEALRLRPDDAEAHNALGMVLGNLGRVEDAAGHFIRAITLMPDWAQPRANLERLEQLGAAAEDAR
jgi:tetratricopeptide (TPR) repeat protein